MSATITLKEGLWQQGKIVVFKKKKKKGDSFKKFHYLPIRLTERLDLLHLAIIAILRVILKIGLVMNMFKRLRIIVWLLKLNREMFNTIPIY